MVERIVHDQGPSRLLYCGTLGGRHEFVAQHAGHRRVLGPISLESAMAALIAVARLSHDGHNTAPTGDTDGSVERFR